MLSLLRLPRDFKRFIDHIWGQVDNSCFHGDLFILIAEHFPGNWLIGQSMNLKTSYWNCRDGGVLGRHHGEMPRSELMGYVPSRRLESAAGKGPGESQEGFGEGVTSFCDPTPLPKWSSSHSSHILQLYTHHSCNCHLPWETGSSVTAYKVGA